jgi:hypothetical protein
VRFLHGAHGAAPGHSQRQHGNTQNQQQLFHDHIPSIPIFMFISSGPVHLKFVMLLSAGSSTHHHAPHGDGTQRHLLRKKPDRLILILQRQRIEQRQIMLIGGDGQFGLPAQRTIINQGGMIAPFNQRLDGPVKFDGPIERRVLPLRQALHT